MGIFDLPVNEDLKAMQEYHLGRWVATASPRDKTKRAEQLSGGWLQLGRSFFFDASKP
jgi:hypothetical protein